MALISLSQILDKDLFATGNVAIFSFPDATSQVVSVARSGERIGKVYSYVQKGSSIYYQLYENNKKAFVLHDPNRISLSALKEQGAQTVKDEIKEQEDQNKTWYEKIFSNVGSFIPKAALAVGAFIIIRDIVKKKI